MRNYLARGGVAFSSLSIFLLHFCFVVSYAQPCDCTYAESPCQTNEFNVFISYSGFDRDIVGELTEELNSKNIPYWDYQESCEVGSNCDLENIRTVIEDSELIVIIRSDKWNSSEICRMEKRFIDNFQSSGNSDNAVDTEDLLNKILGYHIRFPENYSHIFIDFRKE